MCSYSARIISKFLNIRNSAIKHTVNLLNMNIFKFNGCISVENQNINQ